MASTGTPAHGSRGRRAPRVSGDDRERAILETAERLLAERALHEISVDDLARGAGLSRPAFYFYFPSKEAVLLTLLDGVVAEAEAARDAALARADGAGPAEVVRAGIGAFHDTFRGHRAVTLAAADARATSREVREVWARHLRGWVAGTAELVEAQRARGGAPAGVPARDLAIVLNLMDERVLHATFAGEEPAVEEAGVVDALVAVWLAALGCAGGS